jgi:hypothetical protein
MIDNDILVWSISILGGLALVAILLKRCIRFQIGHIVELVVSDLSGAQPQPPAVKQEAEVKA